MSPPLSYCPTCRTYRAAVVASSDLERGAHDTTCWYACSCCGCPVNPPPTAPPEPEPSPPVLIVAYDGPTGAYYLVEQASGRRVAGPFASSHAALEHAWQLAWRRKHGAP
jgi:hypothetical protein